MGASNGYTQLVAAGRSLTGTEILGDDIASNENQAAHFLEANQQALSAARRTLNGECCVPKRNDASFFEECCEDVSPIRDLARSFVLELAAAQRRHDMAQVVAIGLDLFGLANAVRRGGLVINALVAIAFEEMACQQLRPLRRRLSAAESTMLANGLLRVDSEREVFDTIVVRDVSWSRSVQWPESCENSLPTPSAATESDVTDEELEAVQRENEAFAELPLEKQRSCQKQLDYQHLAVLRLLAIESALNACLITRGAYAPDLATLVPEFIAHMPCDPFTGQEFRYRLTGEAYCLYSRGPTGHDSGGTFGHWFEVLAGHADLCLDIADYARVCALQAPRVSLFAALVARVRGWFHSART